MEHDVHKNMVETVCRQTGLSKRKAEAVWQVVLSQSRPVYRFAENAERTYTDLNDLLEDAWIMTGEERTEVRIGLELGTETFSCMLEDERNSEVA